MTFNKDNYENNVLFHQLGVADCNEKYIMLYTYLRKIDLSIARHGVYIDNMPIYHYEGHGKHNYLHISHEFITKHIGIDIMADLKEINTYFKKHIAELLDYEFVGVHISAVPEKGTYPKLYL